MPPFLVGGHDPASFAALPFLPSHAADVRHVNSSVTEIRLLQSADPGVAYNAQHCLVPSLQLVLMGPSLDLISPKVETISTVSMSCKQKCTVLQQLLLAVGAACQQMVSDVSGKQRRYSSFSLQLQSWPTPQVQLLITQACRRWMSLQHLEELCTSASEQRSWHLNS